MSYGKFTGGKAAQNLAD